MFTRCVVALVLPVIALAQAGQANKMTNADVIALESAGMSDDIIIAKIQGAAATDFDTGVAGLKNLQAAHVSTAVIRVMINPHTLAGSSPAQVPATVSAASPDDPNAPHNPGIYMYANANSAQTMTELQRVTPKQTKGSGAWDSGMTYGITKFKVRGVFEGANAPVKTGDPNPVFYLYAPESPGAFGGSYIKPNDFTLIKLTQKNNTREIVEGSGSIWGTTTGTDDKAKRGFSVDQVKPGVYKLTLLQPLPPGEYAFQQNAGSFFDFRILPPE